MDTPSRTFIPLLLPASWPGFQGFQNFEQIEFQGVLSASVYRYQVSFGGTERPLFCTWMIAKEDGLAWKAFRELLEYGVKLAAAQVRGFYGLELLALSLTEGVKYFQAAHFSQLVVNHAKTLNPGEQTLIQYGSLWMLLTKRIEEDWGKIEYKSRVETSGALDSFIKSMMKEASALPASENSQVPLFVFFDLGQTPVFKFGEEVQTSKIIRWFEKLKKEKAEIPEIYIVKNREITDLVAQFGVLPAEPSADSKLESNG